MSKRRRDADPDEPDEFWEGAPDFASPMPPTMIHIPEGPEGVIGFHGKPKPLHGKAKRRAR